MIKARIPAENPEADLGAYVDACRSFSWAEAEKAFAWHETAKINICYEAVDRWADHGERKDRTAFIFERGERISSFTYGELKMRVCRWAEALTDCGLIAGDRLFIYMLPDPDIQLAILACSRIGVIFSPLYATLNYEALEERIGDARPRAVLTHPDLAERLPTEVMESVEYVFFTQGPLPNLFSNEILISEIISRMPGNGNPVWVDLETPLYLIYSSGSTGPPKGIVHSHRDMVGHLVTAKTALDIQDDTILWTDADPAWVTGTVYGIFAPLLCGITSVVQEAGFSPSTWYRTLERHRVSVWYTTPQSLMKLMEEGEDLPARYDLSGLRHTATVGKNLAPEQFYWFRKKPRSFPP